MLWIIELVELLDTLPVMLRLEDALVLWVGPADTDIMELELDVVEADIVITTLELEDAVVDISVL